MLRYICSRMDDDDLKKMASVLGLWNEINAMLRDNAFWKMRIELEWGHTMDGRDANWRRLYYMARMMRILRSIDNATLDEEV